LAHSETFLDPQKWGLTSRDRLVQLDDQHVALVIQRKSRVIMTDGKRLLAKVHKIKSLRPDLDVALKIRAPLCSKTKAFLEGEDILVIQD